MKIPHRQPLPLGHADAIGDNPQLIPRFDGLKDLLSSLFINASIAKIIPIGIGEHVMIGRIHVQSVTERTMQDVLNRTMHAAFVDEVQPMFGVMLQKRLPKLIPFPFFVYEQVVIPKRFFMESNSHKE